MPLASYHKYTVGTDMRRQAMQLSRLVNRAWRDRASQAEYVARLVWAVGEFKLPLQLAKTIKAFTSSAQFEWYAELAAQPYGILTECGWLRSGMRRRVLVAWRWPPCPDFNDEVASAEAHPDGFPRCESAPAGEAIPGVCQTRKSKEY